MAEVAAGYTYVVPKSMPMTRRSSSSYCPSVSHDADVLSLNKDIVKTRSRYRPVEGLTSQEVLHFAESWSECR